MDAFLQVRTFQRAWRLGVTQLLCLGRHTLTNLLCTGGRQFVDWSADYRLFSLPHWDIHRLFGHVLENLLERLPADRPLVVAGDDTLLRKTGTRIPGVGYRRDPLSPKFHANFIRAQRFIQLSGVLSSEAPDPETASTRPGPARCIPVAFEHAPSVPHPKSSEPPERWAEYRQQRRANNLSTRMVAMLKRLRQQLDGLAAGAGRRLVLVVDASYTNRTVLRNLPRRVVLIGRTRKDLKLFDLPEAGSRCRYGRPLATPEQLRQEESVAWRPVRAYAAGRFHDFRVKTMGPVLWKKAGWEHPLRIMVVAPVSYRLRKGSKLLYRQPAFLLCTDVQMSDAELLQGYLWRWGVEVNHRDEKQIVGVGQAQVSSDESAGRQPAFAVFSYAVLLLAGAAAYGVDAIEGLLPLPKWRRKAGAAGSEAGQARCLSTQQMVQELRKEAWAYALDELSGGGEHFVNGTAADAKCLQVPASLVSSALYGSAA